MDEHRKQHLIFLEEIIQRMNKNSFQLKGLSVTIFVALMGFSEKIPQGVFWKIAWLMGLILWALDAYYLQQERKFRGIYKDIAVGDPSIPVYTMPLENYTGDRYDYTSSFFSRTMILYPCLMGIAWVL